MYFRHQYMMVAKNVLKTQPIGIGNMPFILLSMVHHRDVYSYLVAVKSFVRFTNPKRIVVVCDPSIDDTDRKLIRQHIAHIELRDAGEFTHTNIPRGGTWERLFALSGYASENYVVQLDSDTLTIRPNTAVEQAILASRGFVIGEEPKQKPLRLAKIGTMARQWLLQDTKKPSHIQACSEAVMDQLGWDSKLCYIRGCSGFTGFPPDPIMRDKLIHFSTVMGSQLGERWREWGTEQVASNYLVANCPMTGVLPFPTYGTPDVENENTVFLHFIGSQRFTNNRYQVVTQTIIKDIDLD